MWLLVDILFLVVVSKWLEKREEKQRRKEERGRKRCEEGEEV